ncbi:CelD/BcsL family acetyltransferase involved in cellulose biosynthesis [Rhizomicrobium palustre]|uniref:CelD/BcsL family acetyltransferase involved in cellulose biosynthesis n=1 Tax=Rhizomicrobium palustre TaxID=189966 RepID=A0A846MV64_9PROT|nr:GNAT family N-acetyltransferase [Rhizomicrobium palustre]NIK87253.1 CelD/BcsL family acetyltransferase involved in cellulose biosynthesis [Rhizomicrobium palustre]
MNFYATDTFLNAAAEAFFPGRAARIENVAFGEEVLRLLVIDGKPITRLPFLDVHQPLASHEISGTPQKGGFARQVVREILPLQSEYPADPNIMLAPFVDWSLFSSFAAYKDWQLNRHRSRMRDLERRGRSLASQQGEITFTRDDTAEDVLPFAQHWKSQQLIATGHDNYFARPETLAFFQALRRQGALTVSTLRAGGKLASVWIGFIHDRVWSGWVFTYDPAYKKYAAGHQLVGRMLEESYALGHREFDFSEGNEDYKLLYASHARLLGDIGRAPLKRRLVRFAKENIYALSPALLQKIKGLKAALRQRRALAEVRS